MPGGAGETPPHWMVSDIKQRQKSNPTFKDAWWKFCDEEVVGGMRGTRDPSRHSTATLQRFLDSYNAEHSDPEHSRLSNKVKKAYQGNPVIKEQWKKFCENESLGSLAGTLDPSLHTKETLQSFLDGIGWGNAPSGGTMRANEFSMGGGFHGDVPLGVCRFFWQGKPCQFGETCRYLHSMPNMPTQGASGESQADAPPANPPSEKLVDEIKVGQKSDKAYHKAWLLFCDTYAQGIRDPNRHPDSNLELFLNHYIEDELVRQREEMNREPTLHEKVKMQIKEDRRFADAWRAFCDEHCNGIRDPMRHPEPNVKVFMEKVWPEKSQAMPSNSGMAPLVDGAQQGSPAEGSQ